MKKLALLKIVILLIAFGCSNKPKANANLWSLNLGNRILGELKTSNYLFKDSSMVLYADKELIKANINSDEIFWKRNIDENIYATHVKSIGKEILICGFYENRSYLYFIDYESGQINSIDTFPSVIESIYQIGQSSNFIIYQQDIREEPFIVEISEYNYKTKKSLWKIEGMPLVTEPYVDSNYLVFPKKATFASCISRISKQSSAFPIETKNTFALIEKLNRTPKWQLVNLVKGEIDTRIIWDFKFEIDQNIFVAKVGDLKIYQISLNSGNTTPFIELPENILGGASYGTNILLYLGGKKVALVDVLTQKIKLKELEFEPIFGKNSILLHEGHIFYYTRQETKGNIENKIIGETIN